jgi:acyl-coenzyme A thioesterase PaaI-like protein
MTEDELQALLEKTLAPGDLHGLFVEECQDQDVRLRFSLSPGEAWSTPVLLSLLDTALKAAAGVATGMTVRLTHLNVTILRPAQEADVIALSRVIRRDGEVVHAEAWLFSHAVVEPMLHATASLRGLFPG